MYEKNEFNQSVGTLLENWNTVEKPSKRIMQGKYCILELLDIDEHGAQLFDSLSMDNLGDSWTYFPYGPFPTCAEFHYWLHTAAIQNDVIFYVIVDIKTNIPIGIASYLRINPEHGVIEVGHLHFSKILKRSTAATEAMYLMMEYVFDELKYRRYEWKCNSLNRLSRNAAERFGFKFEGVFRQYAVYKNRNRDTAWFSIIDSEWPDIKERFQKWLSPNNFDMNGNQLMSLREI